MKDRRHFLKALAVGSALILAWNPLRRSWVTEAQTAGPDEPLVALPPLDGTIHTDPATLQVFAEDFGRLLFRQPMAVLHPGSINDIMTIIRFARKHRLKVAMNGQAGTDDQRASHSQFGQAQAEAGIVIDVKPSSTIYGIDDQAGVADVDAGVRWSELFDAAAAFGLAPAVMTDYLHLSIGGTLSVGGIGGHIQKHGTQADNVIELQVVTGAGDLVTCSPRQHRRLFMTVLAGCGQVALIVRAKVRLLPAQPSALVFNLFYDDLAAYVEDQTMLVHDGRFDFQAGQLAWREDNTGWRYMIEVVKYFTPPHMPAPEALLAGLQDDRPAVTTMPLSFREWQFRVDALVEFLKGRGAWNTPHPWINLWVSGSKTIAFMNDLAARLTPGDLGLGIALFYPIDTRQVAARLFRLPTEPIAFYLGLLRFPPDDPDVLTAMLTDNRRLYKEIIMGAPSPELVDLWLARAFNTHDVEAAAAMYHPDASVVRLEQVHGSTVVARGAEGIRETMAGYIGLKPHMDVIVHHTTVSSEFALCRSQWRITGTDQHGEPLEVHHHGMEVMRRLPNGEWVFFIDHPWGADASWAVDRPPRTA